jgi:PAS domain-containing protein
MDQQQFWDDFQHLKREATTLRDSVNRLNVLRGRYRALMEHGNLFVAYLDKEGRFLEISQSGLKLIERDEREVVDKLHVEVFGDSESRAIGTAAAEAIRSKEPFAFTWTIRKTNGPSPVYRAIASPVRDETGTVVAACVTALPAS